MVKRGGKEIVTVDIEKDIYETIKKKAGIGRFTVKEYINNILREDANRAKILLKSMPRLTMEGYKKNSMIFVGDEKVDDGLADVFVVAGRLHCEFCDSFECEHVQFASLQPEALHLLKYEKKQGKY